VQEIAERDRNAAVEARRNTERIAQEITACHRYREARSRRRAARERIVQEQARITHTMRRTATDNQTKKEETERIEQEQVRLSSFKILH
jgi:hypothetical protein